MIVKVCTYTRLLDRLFYFTTCHSYSFKLSKGRKQNTSNTISLIPINLDYLLNIYPSTIPCSPTSTVWENKTRVHVCLKTKVNICISVANWKCTARNTPLCESASTEKTAVLSRSENLRSFVNPSRIQFFVQD